MFYKVSDKNSKTETTEVPNAQEHPSVILTTDSQKSAAAPVQTENILLIDQNGHSVRYEQMVRTLHYNAH